MVDHRRRRTATARTSPARMTKGPLASSPRIRRVPRGTALPNAFTAAETKSIGANRDSSIPATAWTPDQRSMYESVGKAMRNAADQTVNLVKVTPHRVMRELYEQFIAYARAFTEQIPQYTAQRQHLAAVVDGSESALVDICGAITYGSAATQAPFVPEARSASQVSHPGDPANPQRFLHDADPVCARLALGLWAIRRGHCGLAEDRSEHSSH